MDHKRGEPGRRLGPADVGYRVVVRRNVGVGRSGRPRYSDLLGELLAADAESLTVRTERGDEVVIATDDVAAGKRVGPRPARYSEIIALELAADEAWPAPVSERLGDWILRAAEGFTNRANSALPLGDAGRPTEEAIDACVAWYRDLGLTPRITVPLPLRRDVAAALTARGWYAQPVVHVQTVLLGARSARAGPGAHEASPSLLARTSLVSPDDTGPGTEPVVRLEPAPSAEFLGLARARKTSLPDAAHRVLTGPAQVRFAEVRADDGTLLAMARGAVVRDWVHLGLVEVVEAARRQGHAKRVSLALMAWGRGLGATRAVLQVDVANEGALALYRDLGFATHHRYVTYAVDSARSADVTGIDVRV